MIRLSFAMLLALASACTTSPSSSSSSSSTSSGGCADNSTTGTFQDVTGDKLVAVPIQAQGSANGENQDSVVSLSFDQTDSVDGGMLRTQGSIQFFGSPSVLGRVNLGPGGSPTPGEGNCHVTQTLGPNGIPHTVSCTSEFMPDGGPRSYLDISSVEGTGLHQSFDYSGVARLSGPTQPDGALFTFSGHACMFFH